MNVDDTLTSALEDVRKRRAMLESEYERLTLELRKLRIAENSLAALVEGTELNEFEDSPRARASSQAIKQIKDASVPAKKTRGSRVNSARNRLRILLRDSGPSGLTYSEILRKLPDVAPSTIGAYLSTMTSSGEATRYNEFYSIQDAPEDPSESPAKTLVTTELNSGDL